MSVRPAVRAPPSATAAASKGDDGAPLPNMTALCDPGATGIPMVPFDQLDEAQLDATIRDVKSGFGLPGASGPIPFGQFFYLVTNYLPARTTLRNRVAFEDNMAGAFAKFKTFGDTVSDCEQGSYNTFCKVEPSAVDPLIDSIANPAEREALSKSLKDGDEYGVRFTKYYNKFLSPEERKMMWAREMWLMVYASLGGIAPFVLATGFGPRGTPIAIMERAPASLYTFLKAEENRLRAGPSIPINAYNVGRAHSDALREVFERSGRMGLLLTDVKTDNMVLYDDGRIHFIDFGADYATVVDSDPLCVEFINATLFLSFCYCERSNHRMLAGLTYDLRARMARTLFPHVSDTPYSADESSGNSLCGRLLNLSRDDREERGDWFDSSTQYDAAKIARKVMERIVHYVEKKCGPTDMQAASPKYVQFLAMRAMDFFVGRDPLPDQARSRRADSEPKPPPEASASNDEQEENCVLPPAAQRPRNDDKEDDEVMKFIMDNLAPSDPKKGNEGNGGRDDEDMKFIMDNLAPSEPKKGNEGNGGSDDEDMKFIMDNLAPSDPKKGNGGNGGSDDEVTKFIMDNLAPS